MLKMFFLSIYFDVNIIISGRVIEKQKLIQPKTIINQTKSGAEFVSKLMSINIRENNNVKNDVITNMLFLFLFKIFFINNFVLIDFINIVIY